MDQSNLKCYQTFNKLDTVCPDCGVKKIFEQNVSFDTHEYETINSKGEKIWIELRVTPLKDKNDEVMAALELAVPITERKETEDATKQAVNQLVLLTEKLNVVGSLTRHDVRNKLFAVRANTYLLKKKYPNEAGVLEGVDKIDQAVKDTLEIFEFAKRYEQLGVEELKYFDVESMFNEAASLFSGLNIKVINECHGLNLLADSFLRQMLYNFIDNTRKYGNKTTTIKFYYEKVNPKELQLIYEDDGVGISAENKSRLFQEGFSTGGSTGYGLFLSRKMMDFYGWQIQETGELGRGAKFVILIPSHNSVGIENFRISP